jgi:DNA-binding XRE family transcriptional regulator
MLQISTSHGTPQAPPPGHTAFWYVPFFIELNVERRRNEVKINEKLRQIRKSKGITQTFIAQKMGKTSAWYSNIERGYTRLLAEDAKRIAEILGVDIREIFEEVRK